LFWTVGFEIGALVCFKKIREQDNFSDDKILELFLIKFRFLIFWVIVGDHLRIKKSCIDILCDWFFWDSLYLCFDIVRVFTVPWIFYLYWEVFPTLIISVDLVVSFQLHIGFCLDRLIAFRVFPILLW